MIPNILSLIHPHCLQCHSLLSSHHPSHHHCHLPQCCFMLAYLHLCLQLCPQFITLLYHSILLIRAPHLHTHCHVPLCQPHHHCSHLPDRSTAHLCLALSLHQCQLMIPNILSLIHPHCLQCHSLLSSHHPSHHHCHLPQCCFMLAYLHLCLQLCPQFITLLY